MKSIFFLLTDLHQNIQVRKLFNFVNNSQWWSESDIKNYQDIKLNQLINHAYRHVAYYRKLFDSLRIKPADIRSAEDLKKLPLLTKDIIRQNHKDLTADNINDLKKQLRRTGGTTGEPLEFYSDMHSWSLHWALKFRAWNWAGYDFGERIAVMAGASLLPDQKPGTKRRIWNRLLGIHPMSMTHSDESIIHEYYKTIKKKEIKIIRGYPTSIASFARIIDSLKMPLRLKSVITTAEVLQPADRKIIQNVFDCQVFDNYGCSDGGGIATECDQHFGMHICPESSIWEFEGNINISHEKKPASEVVLTSLTNYAMPMIRYAPGDLAVVSDKKCNCGRNSLLLEKIIGRTTDVLTFANGRILAGPAFTLIFRNFNILQYQLVQKDVNTLDVNIIPGKNYKAFETEKIRNIMVFHCGYGVTVNVHCIEEIKIPKSGKFRFIVSELN